MADGQEQGKRVLRLDGSHGMGVKAHLTIITADKVMGTKEVTYEFPYTLIDTKMLLKAVDSLFILGFRIEKILTKDDPTLVFTGEGIGIEGGEGEGQ